MSMLRYVDRRNTDCFKWDGLENTFSRSDLLAMWVADMDFQVPECVRRRLADYIELGTFGYYNPPEGYYNAFIEWERRYHGYEVKKDWMRLSIMGQSSISNLQRNPCIFSMSLLCLIGI